MIADKCRHTRVTKGMLAYFFEQMVESEGIGQFPKYIVLKTYNPIVYSLLNSFAIPALDIKLYPQIPARNESNTQSVLAQRIAKVISPKLEFDCVSGAVLGGQALVAPDFFPRMEMSKSEDVNEHFKAHLTRNDQILCILDIPKTSHKTLIKFVSFGRPQKKIRHFFGTCYDA